MRPENPRLWELNSPGEPPLEASLRGYSKGLRSKRWIEGTGSEGASSEGFFGLGVYTDTTKPEKLCFY